MAIRQSPKLREYQAAHRTLETLGYKVKPFSDYSRPSTLVKRAEKAVHSTEEKLIANIGARGAQRNRETLDLGARYLRATGHRVVNPESPNIIRRLNAEFYGGKTITHFHSIQDPRTKKWRTWQQRRYNIPLVSPQSAVFRARNLARKQKNVFHWMVITLCGYGRNTGGKYDTNLAQFIDVEPGEELDPEDIFDTVRNLTAEQKKKIRFCMSTLKFNISDLESPNFPQPTVFQAMFDNLLWVDRVILAFWTSREDIGND